MVVTAKGLSGGIYSIAATLMTGELHSFFRERPFVHVSTFGGAGLGCVAALEVLDIIGEAGFLERVTALGERFEEAFADLPFGLRRRGLTIGLEFEEEAGGRGDAAPGRRWPVRGRRGSRPIGAPVQAAPDHLRRRGRGDDRDRATGARVISESGLAALHAAVEVALVRRGEVSLRVIAYAMQPLLPAETLGPAVLRDADAGQGHQLLAEIVEATVATVGPRLGLDAPVSNWGWRESGAAFFDVTTPFVRDEAGGDEDGLQGPARILP